MPPRTANDISTISPASRLSLLKQERFRPETRGERAAKSLAALNQAPMLHLSPQQWKDAAENPELEEET